MNFFADWATAHVPPGGTLQWRFYDVATRYTKAQSSAAVAIIRFRELQQAMSDDDALNQTALDFNLDSEQVRAWTINQKWRRATKCANEIADLLKSDESSDYKRENL